MFIAAGDLIAVVVVFVVIVAHLVIFRVMCLIGAGQMSTSYIE